MKILSILVLSLCVLASMPAFAGNCDYSWQTASDGSHCGGRGADVRPGGR